MTATAHAYEEPLFRSAHDALKFAFVFSGQQYPLTIMAKMMRGVVGSGKGLVGLDGAAQAGLICLMVKDLPPLHADCLTARYALHEDRRFIEAVNRLCMAPSIAPAGVSNRLERQAIVARYFGEPVSILAIAEKLSLHRVTVSKHQRTMRDKLRSVEESAYVEISGAMQSRGLTL